MIKNKVVYRMIKALSLFFVIVFFFLNICFDAKAYDQNDTIKKDIINSSRIFRPVIEKTSYEIDEIVSMKYNFEGDYKIERIYSISDDFVDIKSPYISCNRILSSVKLIGQKDEVEYSIVAVLDNGKSVKTTIYGIIENNKLYLNCNSFSGARDIYWSEVLSNSINTKNEDKSKYNYEMYLKKVNYGVLKETIIVDNKERKLTKSGNDTSVSGLIQWYDDWGQPHPLQYTKVEIVEEGGGIFGWFDRPFGLTYTNENGEYSFEFNNGNAAKNIYIKIFPAGENFVVKTGSGNDYVLRTETNYGVTAGSSIVRNQDIVNGFEVTQAFQISQAINVSSRFVKEISGVTMPHVTVKYPHNESLNNCYYNNNVIYILGETDDDDWFEGGFLHPYASWDVIQHEYFHHVQEYFEITNNPDGWHVFNINMYDHYISHHTGNLLFNCAYDGGCANPSLENAKGAAISLVYAEAWPSILAEISQQYAIENLHLDVNIHTVADVAYNSHNGTRIHYNDPDVSSGEGFEASVMGILWDLYDSDSEYFDKIALGTHDFWDLSINSGAKSLSEFINYFNAIYSSFYYLSKLGNILSFYRVGASGVDCLANSQNPPTFSWTPNGLSANLQNNSFDIIFYNSYKSEILRINTSSTFITLTQEQWDTILYSIGTQYYVTILTYQTSNPVTGGYYSNFIECSKPEVEDIISNIFIAENNRYQEQIFMLRQNQSLYCHITFATPGNKTIQTFGRKDTMLYLYSSTGNLLDSNDDAGYFFNAFINYNFIANEEYIIKVKYYSQNEAGECKLGTLSTDRVSNNYEQIPYFHLGNGTVGGGQRVYVSQNSVYMYTITTTDSGYYHITTTQDNGCNINDTYLYFINPDLTTLCVYDDDSGDGYNASLDVYLEANKPYLLIVSPYSITGTSGSIWLTIHTA